MKEETRQQIQVFSAARMKQKHIAQQLGVSIYLVRKTQKEFALLPNSTEPLPPATQKQILTFLRKHGAPTIARILGVPQHQIYRVAREAKFTRPPGSTGFRYRFTPEQLRTIRRAIRTSEARIAKKFGTSREWISAFRHRMWRTYRNEK
jgi:glycerol dehydrogenase-like iron-containing ADH family enzyme